MLLLTSGSQAFRAHLGERDSGQTLILTRELRLALIQALFQALFHRADASPAALEIVDDCKD